MGLFISQVDEDLASLNPAKGFTLVVFVCSQAAATKSELPIGVFRGCPSCRTCQKVKLGTFHFDMLDSAFCGLHGLHDSAILEPRSFNLYNCIGSVG